MRRHLFATLLGGLAAVALVTGCNEPQDPSADGGNGGTPGGSSGDAVDDVSDASGGLSGDGSGGDSEGGGDGGSSAGDTGDDGGATGDDGGGTTADVMDGGSGDTTKDFFHSGGNAVADSPGNVLESGTGIQTVLDRFDSIMSDADQGGEGAWPTNDEDNSKTVTLDEPIEISGAVVTATNNGARGQLHFWLQDADGVVEIFIEDRIFPDPDPWDSPVIKVGQSLTLNITGLKNFNGIPEITQVESPPTVDSSGNDVPYTELTSSSELDSASWGHIVKVSGVLTNGKTGEDCPGPAQQCYDLEFGSGATVPFRVPVGSDLYSVSADKCITYVGPLDEFVGPVAVDGPDNLQLNLTNFSWATDQYAVSEGSCEFSNPEWTGQIFTPSENGG